MEVSLLLLSGQRVGLNGLCISVEVLRVDQVLYLGHPGRWYAAFKDHFEINSAEPLVSFNFVCTVLHFKVITIR